MRYTALAVLALICLTACGKNEKSLFNAPEAEAVTIGVVYPVEANDPNTYLRQGIELAVEQINESGGVLGKRLDIHLRDDENNETTAVQIAQSFADDNITAVVGHWSSNINYTTEDIYEENGVVLVMPCATSTNLFDYDYNYIFRMCPNSYDFAESIADYIAKSGYQRIAICYSDDIYGRDFAENVERSLNSRNVIVVDRLSSLTAANASRINARWSALGCDGVVTGNLIPGVFDTIGLIRGMDGDYPIFGADNFQRLDFSANLNGDTSNLYRIENSPESMDPEFLQSFADKYGNRPDIFAVAGYEAVWLIRDAMEACGSIDATLLAEYMADLTDYPAAAGTLTYNSETGEFDGHQVHIAEFE